MSKEITIDFEDDGSIKIEGKNFKGAECDAAMAHFEKALGTQTSRKNKPEYHAAQSVSQHARN